MKYILLLLLCCFLTACPAPTPAPNTDDGIAQKTADSVGVKTGEVVGNVATNKYHVAPCYYIPLIKQTRRFASTSEARSVGFTCDSASNGCKSCSK